MNGRRTAKMSKEEMTDRVLYVTTRTKREASERCTSRALHASACQNCHMHASTLATSCRAVFTTTLVREAGKRFLIQIREPQRRGFLRLRLTFSRPTRYLFSFFSALNRARVVAKVRKSTPELEQLNTRREVFDEPFPAAGCHFGQKIKLIEFKRSCLAMECLISVRVPFVVCGGNHA